MRTISFPPFFLLFFSISLCLSPHVLLSYANNQLSPAEIHLIDQNPEEAYVYLDRDNRIVKNIIMQLKDFDNSSILQQFHNYIEKGHRLVEYEALMHVLEQAEKVLQKNKRSDCLYRKRIAHELDQVIAHLVDAKSKTNNKKGNNERVISLPASLEIFDINTTPSSLFSQRLVAKTPALVVANTNVSLSGLSAIDGVSLAVNDRVLLVNQTNAVENGLWLAQAGSWTRPADFASTTLAGEAYVLIQDGDVNAGSSWLSTTPTAIIDTDPITFALFSYPDIVLADNVGSGVGLVFRDKTGTTLNFRSLRSGSGVIITNNADDITIDVSDTSLNNPNTLVSRDNTGSFAAEVISMTDGIISSSLTITPFTNAGIVHNNASGVLTSSLIVNADISSSAAISDSKLAPITTAGKISNTATTANSANLANAIVLRDAAGNFSANTITANLNGTATTANTATTAITTTDFTGSLSGDVTGTQNATVISSVGGQAAALVATATTVTNAATSNNTANAIVRRNASGNFSAGAISITDAVISNSLKMIPFATAGILHNAAGGTLSSSLIVNADISASAAIVDTKLATISTAGKVANSATTATSLNAPNTIVSRDASGNLNATVVIADLLGTASNNLLRAGDTMTGALQLPAGTAALPSLRFTGSTTAGLSTTSGNLLFSTNALERMRISSGGIVSIKSFTSAGVVKNDALGNLSSSLIVDSNIAPGAGIIDTKLATISTAGKVANSATTATHLNAANAIVNRDVSGNFEANKIQVVDLAATGNIILSTNPSTSSAGNIWKDVNTPFIHNFGTNNTFVGINAGNFSMSGNGQNSIFGSNAFSSNTTGDGNTGIGFAVLPSCTTGSSNIAIGTGAGATLTTGNDNIYIDANAIATNESSTTRIGTFQTRCFIAGIRGIATGNANGISVLIDSSGQLGTISSSVKVKHDIEDMGDASHDILRLRPVTFIYNNDKNNTKQFGLIAEEVDKVFPAIVAKNNENQPESVQYHVLPVLLLNEMKKQQVTIDHLKEVIVSLQNQVKEFTKRINALEKKKA